VYYLVQFLFWLLCMLEERCTIPHPAQTGGAAVAQHKRKKMPDETPRCK